MRRRCIISCACKESNKNELLALHSKRYCFCYASARHSIFRPYGAPSFKRRLSRNALRAIKNAAKGRHKSSPLLKEGGPKGREIDGTMCKKSFSSQAATSQPSSGEKRPVNGLRRSTDGSHACLFLARAKESNASELLVLHSKRYCFCYASARHSIFRPYGAPSFKRRLSRNALRAIIKMRPKAASAFLKFYQQKVSYQKRRKSQAQISQAPQFSLLPFSISHKKRRPEPPFCFRFL